MFTTSPITRETCEQRLDRIARASVGAAITDGHKPVTADVADGTVVSSHVNVGCVGQGIKRHIVKRREDGRLALYDRRSIAYDFESPHILPPERFGMFSIDPENQTL